MQRQLDNFGEISENGWRALERQGSTRIRLPVLVLVLYLTIEQDDDDDADASDNPDKEGWMDGA